LHRRPIFDQGGIDSLFLTSFTVPEMRIKGKHNNPKDYL